jgi:hypothetical protein
MVTSASWDSTQIVKNSCSRNLPDEPIADPIYFEIPR